MAWVRISDDFYDHEKHVNAGALGIALWVAGLAYCNRNLTDGRIPTRVAHRLVDFHGLSVTVASIGDLAGVSDDDCAPYAIGGLLDSGLWHEDDHDCDACPQPGPDRYVVHDYLSYQPSKEHVERERGAARERMASIRANRKKRSGVVRANIEDGSGEVRSTPTPNPTHRKTTRPPADADDPEFDQWWTLYPRKVKKDAARRAFKAALKRATFDDLIAGLRKQLPALQARDPQYVPHPSTWLNSGSWADEPVAVQQERVPSYWRGTEDPT